MSIEIFGCLLILAGLLYWSSAKALQELAYSAVRQRCQKLQLQMLDDYVALKAIRINRNHQRSFQFLRTYGFEFSSTGNERYHGEIVILGREIQSIQFEAYRMPEIDVF